MSFALTTEQLLARTKTVTRRRGWQFLKVGEQIQPVRKSQGIRKGGHVERLGGPIQIVDVRFEPLVRMELADVAREGFPGWCVEEFIAMFCRTHACQPQDEVTRIEFAYVAPVEREVELAPDAATAALTRTFETLARRHG